MNCFNKYKSGIMVNIFILLGKKLCMLGGFMPDILTHILFSEKLAAGIEDENVKHFISENEQLFMLGAQGPDMFYYFKPWNPYGKVIRKVGISMHSVETGRFFIDAIDKLSKTTGKEYERFLVYVLGFLSHYYCDKSVHPYVYSMVKHGCFKFSKGKRKLSHYELESAMDERLWYENKGEHASVVNNAEMVNPGILPDEIVEYISEYVYKTQNKIITAYEIRKSHKNMISVLNILYDPKHKKKRIINLFPLSRKCYVDNSYASVDILNEKKRKWEYEDGSGESDQSVYEIISTASEECVKIANHICEYLESGNEKEFDLIIPDESYCLRGPTNAGDK